MMKRKNTGILKTLALLMGLSLFTSCINDHFPEEQEPTGDKGVTINLSILAGGLMSRTGTNEKGEEYESAINVKGGDYAIFIFDENGDYLDRFEPEQVTLKSNGSQTVDGVEVYTYNVMGFFYPDREVKKVQLLVLANWKTFGGNYDEVEKELKSREAQTEDPSDLEYLFTENASFIYTYPVQTEAGVSTSWTPKEHPGIPMVALSEPYPLWTNGNVIAPTNPINALRSLAKIEIVDKAPDAGVKIKECVLTGYNRSGRYIPIVESEINKDWNKQKVQVTTPSLAGEQILNGNLKFVTDKRMVTPEGGLKEEERNVYSVYIPEMDLTDGNITRPKIKITLENKKEYEVELATYDGEGKPLEQEGSIAYFDNILRNHRYRFNILAVSGIDAELELLIDTDKWDLADDEYYYDDIEVEFEKDFKWEWGKDNIDFLDPFFDIINSDHNSDLLKGWNKDYTNTNIDEWPNDVLSTWPGKNIVVSKTSIEGIASFTISKPLKGKWTLSLFSDDETHNHWFYMNLWDFTNKQWIEVDRDENNLIISDVITGKILSEDNPEIRIRILGQDLHFEEKPFTARLVMNITTFDGQMFEVDLVNKRIYPSNILESNKEYYWIIQYPTPKL